MTRHHHHHHTRSPRQDAQLEKFLSNVERLDDGNRSDLDDYNNLDNLAYKSAYNYDRTFNSTVKGINPYPSDNEVEIDGEYVVSREDYILLQKIKQQQQQEQGETKEPKQRLPSRGHARDHDKDSKKDAGPKLPPRKPKELNKIDPYEKRFERYTKVTSKNKSQDENKEEEEFKPALPKRNVKVEPAIASPEKPLVVPREISDNIEIHERNKPKPLPRTPPKHKKNNDSDIVNVKYTQEIGLIDLDDDKDDKEENRPNLPPKHFFNKDPKPIVKKEAKPVVKRGSKPIVKRESKPMQFVAPEPIELIDPEPMELEPPIPRVNRASKPLTPTKPSINRDSKPVGFIDSLQNNKLTNSKLNNNKFNESPGRSKPIDYLESMQNNNTTSISTQSDKGNSSLTRGSKHLDYLDSMQENATTKVTTHKTSQPSSPSKSPTRLPKSESFIESALKNSESSHNLSLKQKPLLPTKPQNLAENKFNAPPKPPKHDDLIELPQLRKIEKPTPTSPHRNKAQESVDLPKLKSVKKKTPPPVNKSNKPSNIELPQLQSVKKKTPPLINKNKKPDLPEAFLKRDNLTKFNESRQLNKSKTVPLIPERKISMPEALKRAQQLKQNKNQPPKEALQTIEDKLSSVLQLQKRHTLGDGSSAFNRPPQPNKPFTSPMSSTEHSSSSLPQLTKRRTKGPKRKLPTKI